jgi:hypothetical protein
VDTILGTGVSFPEIDPEEWQAVAWERQEMDEAHALSFTFVTYQRVRQRQHAA